MIYTTYKNGDDWGWFLSVYSCLFIDIPIVKMEISRAHQQDYANGVSCIPAGDPEISWGSWCPFTRMGWCWWSMGQWVNGSMISQIRGKGF